MLATAELPVAVDALLVDEGEELAEPAMLTFVLLLLAKFELLLEDGVLAEAVLLPGAELLFELLFSLALFEPFMLLEPFAPAEAFEL